MPKWAQENPKEYWQAADNFERANGRLFVHVEFALPIELSREQQKVLAESFSLEIARTSQGQRLPYSLAIHKGRGENNPHCHLLINERINDGVDRKSSDWFRRANIRNPEKAGAQKAEELRSREWLRNIRAKWAELANLALKNHGHDLKIDHRTLAAQGIDREPQYHLGPAAAAMERKNGLRGIATARGAEYHRQREIAALEKKITALKAEKARREFGRLDVEKIQSGREDIRAKFERWKEARPAREEPPKKRETQNEERPGRPKIKGGPSR